MDNTRGGILTSAEKATKIGPQGDSAYDSERPVSLTNNGVPLTVVSTGSGDNAQGEVVTLEDPEGIQFQVPIEWFGSKVDPRTTHSIDHTVIKAPEGALEEAWRDATRQDYVKARQKLMAEGAIPYSPNIDASKVWSTQDVWAENNTTNPGYVGGEHDQGGFGGQDYTDAQSVMMPGPANAASAFQASRAQLQRRNPTNAVPANAGTGWGNWDQVYDATKKRWKKDPNSQ